MRFLQRLLGVHSKIPSHSRGSNEKRTLNDATLFPGAQEMRVHCTHGRETEKFSINVLGVPCEFLHFDTCAACLEAYLNRTSMLCAECGKPIFPGMRVAGAWIGAPSPYTHNTLQCGAPGLWCGTWGEGRLIKIEETHDFLDYGEAILITPKEKVA